MNARDRAAVVERYEAWLGRHGETPQGLGWGRHGRQEVRFAVLAASALAAPESSVLDAGCGLADLYDFLVAAGWRGRYVGVDVVPAALDAARRRHPQLDLRLLDIASDEHRALHRFDLTVASGVFNAALASGDTEAHVRTALANMFAHTGGTLAVDFLSTWVDFQRPGAWHTDPAWALAAGRALSPRLALRLDYMPFELALFVYRDAARSARNVYTAHEPA